MLFKIKGDAYMAQKRALKEKNARYPQDQFLKELPHRLIKAQEEEWARIALGIHEDIAQSLASLKMFIQAKILSHGQDNGCMQSSCAKVVEELNQIIEKARNLAYGLRPSTLKMLGLIKSIQLLIHSFIRKSNLQVSFIHSSVDNLDLKEDAIHLYRIIQEALINTIQHARATRVEIVIKKSQRILCVTIKDNGKGFFIKNKNRIPKGLGLLTIEERAKLLDADFCLSSEPMEGTKITLKIPLKK